MKKLEKKTIKKLSFFAILALLLYLGALLATSASIDYISQDKNLIHEIIGECSLLILAIIAYKKLYTKQKVKSIKEVLAERKEMAKKLSQEENDDLHLQKIIQKFRPNTPIEELLPIFDELSDLAINHTKKRQEAINYLCSLNIWMGNYKNFLTTQNLLKWKITQKPIPDTEQFPIKEEQQKLSINAILYIEKIIKAHCIQKTQRPSIPNLKLSGEFIPALDLESIYIPPNAIDFSNGYFWQTSLAGAEIEQISFQNAEFQSANFWKTKFINVNFFATNITDSKFIADVSQAINLSNTQLFSTKQWNSSILSEEQIASYFPEKTERNDEWEKWQYAQKMREELIKYFKKTENPKTKLLKELDINKEE